jgi:hypothetical protein
VADIVSQGRQRRICGRQHGCFASSGCALRASQDRVQWRSVVFSLLCSVLDPHDSRSVLGTRPLMIAANKQDSAMALSVDQIASALSLSTLPNTNWFILPCSARDGSGTIEVVLRAVRFADCLSLSLVFVCRVLTRTPGASGRHRSRIAHGQCGCTGHLGRRTCIIDSCFCVSGAGRCAQQHGLCRYAWKRQDGLCSV